MFGFGESAKLKKTISNLEFKCAVYLSSIVTIREKYEQLNKKWGDLVDKINSKGGTDFLNNAVMPSQNISFTKEELRWMIQHLHQDKHSDSRISHEVMVKLNKIKDSL